MGDLEAMREFRGSKGLEGACDIRGTWVWGVEDGFRGSKELGVSQLREQLQSPTLLSWTGPESWNLPARQSSQAFSRKVPTHLQTLRAVRAAAYL